LHANYWIQYSVIKNPLNFKFANVFLEIKKVWQIKKNVKKRKKRDQSKKRKKRFFTSML